jgi:ribonuclease R
MERELGLGRKNRRAIKRAVSELIREGLVEHKKGGWYRLGRRKTRRMVRGVYRHSSAGYGFVDPVGGGAGIFVPPGRSGAAMSGDLVKVEVSEGRRGKGPLGWVESVVERQTERLVGTALRLGDGWILEPDDSRLGVSMDLEEPKEPCDDMAVVAEIVRFPRGPRDTPRARVVEVLGKPGDLETECRKILVMGDVPDAFSEQAMSEAEQAAKRSVGDEARNRRDLRHLPFLTIDPSDAKDFDDAVCVETLSAERNRLWVAIADVSFYVDEGSALDEESQQRGFSVYLPHRAVPMLPSLLSKETCSLEPEKDRLAMVVAVDLDSKGGVHDRWAGEAVIRSRHRLDYETVAAVLSGDASVRRELEDGPLDQIIKLDEVSRVLWAKRRRRGMLEIELGEPKVVLSSTEPLEVADVTQQKPDKWVRQSYRLIEHCMLEANEAVGHIFSSCRQPVVWRIHPEADTEKLERFADLLAHLGMEDEASMLREREPSVKALSRVAKKLGERPESDALSILMLGSLMQASYSFENEGHYALAAEAYLHFTSPIRRYPDLMVHRRLKEILGEADPGFAAHLEKKGPKEGGDDEEEDLETEEEMLAAQLSERERTVVEVEREAVDLFSAALMEDRVGQEAEGMITAATEFGVFVRLDSPYIEGLVRMESLGKGEWELDQTGFFLVARRSGRRLGPGSRVKVRVESVSVLRRQIEMSLVEKPGSPATGTGRRKRSRRSRR